MILAALGIVTDVLFFIADRSEKLGTQLGSILMGSWLIAGGLTSLFQVHFIGSGVIFAVLAVATGVLVLITRR